MPALTSARHHHHHNPTTTTTTTNNNNNNKNNHLQLELLVPLGVGSAGLGGLRPQHVITITTTPPPPPPPPTTTTTTTTTTYSWNCSFHLGLAVPALAGCDLSTSSPSPPTHHHHHHQQQQQQQEQPLTAGTARSTWGWHCRPWRAGTSARPRRPWTGSEGDSASAWGCSAASSWATPWASPSARSACLILASGAAPWSAGSRGCPRL